MLSFLLFFRHIIRNVFMFYGVRKYNKDAFIIISNQSRRDLTGSQPMDREHKPQHPYEPKKEVKKDAT